MGFCNTNWINIFDKIPSHSPLPKGRIHCHIHLPKGGSISPPFWKGRWGGILECDFKQLN